MSLFLKARRSSQGSCTHRLPQCSIRRWIFVVGSAAASLASVVAGAAGKSTPPVDTSNQCKPPVATVARPYREAWLRPVATRSFVLPNGSQIDLTQDLSTIFTGMVSRQTLFTPTEGGLAPTDPCAKQIELKATVSSFELKNTQLGVSFGYTPSGAIVPNLKLTGSVDFNIGSLTMDFSVWECTGVGAARKCTVIAASAADHRLAQITFAIRVDFDQIGGGTSLVYNTRVRDAIDAIMVKGLEGLMASPRIDDLGWKAVVREWHPDSGTVVFNSGQRDGVKANQAFTVYAATSANSSCDVYKAVAHVKTSQVDLLASSAVISSVLDARGIQVGDWVYVRPGAP